MRKFSNLLILLIGFGIVLLSGCSFAKDDAPEAKIPVITSITPDVTTLLNIEKEVIVTVEVEDKGVLSYQWYVAESKLSKGTAIENANEQSFLPPVTEVGTLYYYCIINNQLGESSRSVISPLITFTVKENISAQTPIIIEQPTAQALEMGKNFILNVAAYSPDNGVLTYQWYFSAQGSSEEVVIENATESSYEGSVTKQTIGNYWCTVTSTIEDNGDGGVKTARTESNKVLVRNNIVNAANPIILKNPEKLALDFNEKFSLNVIAYSVDKGTLSYQWYKDEKIVEGATSSTYKGTVSSATLGDYYCEVTSTITDNGDGGTKAAKVKSETVAVESTTINAKKPIIQQMPVNISAEYGILFSLNVVAHSPDEGTLSYQWYKDNQKIDGAIYSTYRGTISSATLGEYYCEVISTIEDNGDGGVKTAKEITSIAIISKNIVNANAPVINKNLDSVSSAFGESFTFSVAAYSVDNGTLSYQWYRNESPIEGAVSQIYTGTVSAETVGNYYCEVTNIITDNGDGGNKTSKVRSEIKILSYSVIDAAKPEILLQPENVVTAFGNDFEFTVIAKASDNGNLSYRWFRIDEDGEPQIVPATGNKITGIMFDGIEGSYYCEITNTISDNGDGGKKSESVTTNSVLLAKSMINALTPVITNQPADAIMYVPAVKVLFTGATVFDDGRLSYQWYSVEDGEDEGVAIEDATEARYKIYAGEEFKKGYYCVVTNTLVDNGDGGVKTASVRSFTAWVDAVSMEDVVSAPDFTVQPTAMNIAPYNQSINLSCEAESGEGTVFYRWYQSTDGTTGTGTPVAGATSAVFNTPVYTERGIYYYYCVATNVFNDVKSAAVISDVVSVAYTGLPVVVIDTVDGEEPTATEVHFSDYGGNYGASLRDATKVPGRIRIFIDGNESPVYDSGEYEKKKSGMTVKLRGNTSATRVEKKPYKIKLQKKADLLADILGRSDKDYADKDWILLKDSVTLRTFIGLAVSDYAGVPWTPKFAFVNVVFNDDYRGPYLLIESINQSKKRIDVADDGYIIERDAYWWNEDVKFFTDLNQKYTFKYPDSEDITEEQILYIKNYMNRIEQHILDGTYDEYIDVESFARWQLIHDILGTSDGAGSNIYMTKYDSSEDSKLSMATPWDFDTIYVRKDNFASTHGGTRIYSKWLFSSDNKEFLNSYKNQWNQLSSNLWPYLSVRLAELENGIGRDIDISRKCNNLRWGTNYSNLHDDVWKAKTYILSRGIWLNEVINELE